jgi:tRNA 2-thiouridine synthesizing protein A
MIGMTSPVTIAREIDARGSYCPGPLMELIRGIRTAQEDEVIAVISSDPGSRTDIPLWVQKTGNELLAVESVDGGAARFIVRKRMRR